MYRSDIDVNRARKCINAPKIQRQHEGKEIVSVEDYDKLFTYFDFLLSKKTRRIPQGIDTEAGLALRVETEATAGTAEEKAVEKTFGKTFRIPIDSEMLSDMSPFSQNNLKDKLWIDIRFNSPKAVILERI